MHAGFDRPSLYKNPGYDPYKSFEPIGLVVDVPMTIIAFRLPAQQHPRAGRVRQKNKDKVSLANAGIAPATCAAPCWSKPWACNC